MVSANHWLRGIKNYRLSWHLTRVSPNHASSNWAQEGSWETRGGEGASGKITTRERGVDVKFNTYRGGGGHYFFHSFSQTEKVVEGLLEFKYFYLLTLELNWLII